MSAENLVSIDIPEEDIKKVQDALKIVTDIMRKYLIALSPDQRRMMLKMGDGSEPFVIKVLDYVKSNPQFLPAVLSPEEMEKDWKVINQLVPFLRIIDQLASNLSDTIMEAGSELYKACLGYYKGVEIGAEMNYPDAKPIAEDLGKRFAGQGRRKKPPGDS